MPDFHEDRDRAWMLGLADAVAAEMVTTREVALDRMAIVFGGAAAASAGAAIVGTWASSPFRAARTIVDLKQAGELCEHLAEAERAGQPEATSAPGAAPTAQSPARLVDEVGTPAMPGMGCD